MKRGFSTGEYLGEGVKNISELEEKIDLIKQDVISSFTRRLSKITEDYLSDKMDEDYFDRVTEKLSSDYREAIKNMRKLDLGIRKLSCEKSYSLA